MKTLVLSFIIFLLGCSSARLVENWKNPEIVLSHANKVLIVGMTQNEVAREGFESRLKHEFDKRGVEAMRSIDLFDVAFTHSEKSEKELDDFERSLLNKDFDAVLFTKVVGSEDRQTFRKKLSELNSYYGKFKDDYRKHQAMYYEDNYYEPFTVYHAETSLYCICEGKERALIWRGAIDITDPKDIQKTTKDYVKLVVTAMEEQNLIFMKDSDIVLADL